MRQSAVVILRDESGRVALQLRDNSDTIPFPNCWGLFGGWLDASESPVGGAIREVGEELSLRLTPDQLTYVGKFRAHVPECYVTLLGPTILIHVFLVRIPASALTEHPSEGRKAVWRTVDEAKNESIIPYHRDILDLFAKRALMMAIVLNLVSAAIGFVIGQGVAWARGVFRRRDRRWFWEYTTYKKITILIGRHAARQSGGEIEPAMNIVDAITFGELRTFLAQHFREVLVATDEAGIDWESPVVSLGGPLANAMTARLGEAGRFPVWFKGMPYTTASTREIGGHGMSFRSEFDADGTLNQDVGFVAKASSEKSKSIPLFVLASNYGAGNHGVARLITTDAGLKKLRRLAGRRQRFQAVLQSAISRNISVSSSVVTVLDA